jgi:hypothetical protein
MCDNVRQSAERAKILLHDDAHFADAIALEADP